MAAASCTTNSRVSDDAYCIMDCIVDKAKSAMQCRWMHLHLLIGKAAECHRCYTMELNRLTQNPSQLLQPALVLNTMVR